MKTSKGLSVLLSFVTAALVLSGAVAVPLLCRPFYYAHISAFRMPEQLGLPEEMIRQAYDQVMDYCLGLSDRFSAGIFPFSESGARHFADVRALFIFDLAACGVCLVILLGSYLWCRHREVEPYRLKGHGPGFWAAVGLTAAFVVIGGLAALDFEKAFVLFHRIFFPGQDNWLFSVYEDPVILILPEAFFRNCAILILALVVVWSLALVAVDIWNGRRIRWAEEQAKLPPCHRTAFKQKK